MKETKRLRIMGRRETKRKENKFKFVLVNGMIWCKVVVIWSWEKWCGGKEQSGAPNPRGTQPWNTY